MRIGDRNIADWGIVTGFKINTPNVKKKTYDIPGRHGKIDASEALTGYPIYDDRNIEIYVFVKEKTADEYQRIYDDIFKFCHGKVEKIVFPFDAEYYYKGRLSVYVSQKDLYSATVTISAECYPYALKENLTSVDISSTTGEERTVQLLNSGMPTKLFIETNNDITIKRKNKISVYNGSTVIYEPLLIDDEEITVSGIAEARIYYQEGKI